MYKKVWQNAFYGRQRYQTLPYPLAWHSAALQPRYIFKYFATKLKPCSGRNLTMRYLMHQVYKSMKKKTVASSERSHDWETADHVTNLYWLFTLKPNLLKNLKGYQFPLHRQCHVSYFTLSVYGEKQAVKAVTEKISTKIADFIFHSLTTNLLFAQKKSI